MLLSWCLVWYRASVDRSTVFGSPVTQERLRKTKRKDWSLIIFAQMALSSLSSPHQLVNQQILLSRSLITSYQLLPQEPTADSWSQKSEQKLFLRERVLLLSQLWRFKSGTLRECFCDRLSSCQGMDQITKWIQLTPLKHIPVTCQPFHCVHHVPSLHVPSHYVPIALSKCVQCINYPQPLNSQKFNWQFFFNEINLLEKASALLDSFPFSVRIAARVKFHLEPGPQFARSFVGEGGGSLNQHCLHH